VKTAYIDTSLIIGLRFQKAERATARAVGRYDLFSSELLIAEVLAFGKREAVDEDLLAEALKGVSWVIPEGSISEECRRVARSGYVRGADLWHLACACYLSPDPTELAFLTMDERQRELALSLGFQAPPLKG
jgi:hypothetical protein